MQCPKCLAIFVSNEEPAAGGVGGMEHAAAAGTGNGSSDTAAWEQRVALLEGCIAHLRQERQAWADRVRELTREHGELARQFSEVVGAYDALLTVYTEAMQALPDTPAMPATEDSPDPIAAGANGNRLRTGAG